MRIDAKGRWFYLGSEIRRERMVALFSTILDFDGQRYSLVTPGERLWITVEDAPFVALLLNVEGQGVGLRLTFTDNVGNQFTAGIDRPIWMAAGPNGDPRPYVMVRDRLFAVMARAVYYQLAEYVCEHQAQTGIWCDGVFFSLEEK